MPFFMVDGKSMMSLCFPPGELGREFYVNRVARQEDHCQGPSSTPIISWNYQCIFESLMIPAIEHDRRIICMSCKATKWDCLQGRQLAVEISNPNRHEDMWFMLDSSHLLPHFLGEACRISSKSSCFHLFIHLFMFWNIYPWMQFS